LSGRPVASKAVILMTDWLMRDSGTGKRVLADWLRRFPIVAKLPRMLLRARMARFSVGVMGVIRDETGRILLVKHVFHPDWPWGLPGGWLTPGERPADGLRRELLEETGLTVQVLIPLLVDTVRHSRHLDIAYLCRPDGEVTHLNAELLDFDWAAPDALPPLHPFHREAIEAALTFPDVEVIAWR
jgi:8-oxo-dGTP diphosphatase